MTTQAGCRGVRRVTLAVLITLAAGCSLLRPPPAPVADRAPVDTWPATPASPVTAHVFDRTDPGQTVFGDVQVIRARAEDAFPEIARTYGLGFDELVAANPGVDPWLPGAGTRIILPTRFVLPEAPHEGLVLNIAAKRLYHFVPAADGAPAQLVTYPMGIGRVGWATPTGSSEVIAKATDPAWYVPASVRAEHREAGDPLPAVVPPGPDNPLGRHVLKLDLPGYLIHGTNQPYGVGMRVSHGCVRLYPEDIEALYAVVPLGTPVTIVNQPVVVGRRDGQAHVAAFPVLEDDERSRATLLDEARRLLGGVTEPGAEVMAEMGRLLEQPSGIAHRWGPAGAHSAQPVPVANVAALPADGPSREETNALLEALLAEAEDEAGATP